MRSHVPFLYSCLLDGLAVGCVCCELQVLTTTPWHRQTCCTSGQRIIAHCSKEFSRHFLNCLPDFPMSQPSVCARTEVVLTALFNDAASC